jgi:hypothetical protein
MKIEAFPGEVMFLTFKLENGSGWLTSHRLILCEHEPGHLEGQTPEVFLLEDLQNAQIDGQTLTAQFQGKQKVRIQLQTDSISLLQEIKKYSEEASKKRKSIEDTQGPPFESRCWRMFTEYLDNEQMCPCGSGKVAYKCCIPRMPRDHITKWYLRSQGKNIEFSVVDRFISLWIAFVSWSEFESKGETDREIMQWLKKSTFVIEIFRDLEKDEEFHNALQELREIPIHRYIKDEQVTIHKIKDLSQVLEFIYVVRCNLFHGHEDLEDDYLIIHCFTILNKIFSRIIEKDDQLISEPGRFLVLT